VRAEAGWHIAPVVTETLRLESYGGTWLPLPSRRVTAISAVRDLSTGSPVSVSGWVQLGSQLYLSRFGWSVGVVEVDVTHGYASTPLDLYPVVAARAAAAPRPPGVSQSSTSVGPFSESQTFRAGAVSDPVVARYALLAGVA
jgi:hypothetical protein